MTPWQLTRMASTGSMHIKAAAGSGKGTFGYIVLIVICILFERVELLAVRL